MYRLVRATASGPRGSAPVWARKVYSTENQENTTEPPPLSITEENVLTVKRRTRKPKAPKVQVEAAPVLFTPLSVTTSNTVRFSLLQDISTHEPRFVDLVEDLHKKVLSVGDFGAEFDMTVIQGGELMGIEAVLSQTVPVGGKVLVISNGTDGERIKNLAKFYSEVVELSFAENEQVDIEKVRATLQNTSGITNVAMVHCETSSGVVLPWKELVKTLPTKPTLFADVSNTFGAADLSWSNEADYLYVAPHKSLQAVPGFGIIIFKKEKALAASTYPKKSLALDFISQWNHYKQTGEHLYTPPTHALHALKQATIELEEEGGWKAREQRYKENHDSLVKGMTELGFETVLPTALRSHFFTYFKYPTHPKFNWDDFSADLRFHGFSVSLGHKPNTFGVSTVGHLFSADVARFLSAVKLTKEEMQF